MVSGNAGNGIQAYGSAASANVLLGNLIGTDLSGLHALGNAGDGVFVNGAPNNTVGGVTAGARNVIAANLVGVQLYGPAATGNVVQGDLIGTDVSGAPRLSNRYAIYVNNAPGNTVGGTGAAANVVVGDMPATTAPKPSAATVGASAARVTQITPILVGTRVTQLVIGVRGTLDADRRGREQLPTPFARREARGTRREIGRVRPGRIDRDPDAGDPGRRRRTAAPGAQSTPATRPARRGGQPARRRIRRRGGRRCLRPRPYRAGRRELAGTGPIT